MSVIKKLVEEIIGSREAVEPKPWKCPICGHDQHYEIGAHDRFGWGTSHAHRHYVCGECSVMFADPDRFNAGLGQGRSGDVG